MGQDKHVKKDSPLDEQSTIILASTQSMSVCNIYILTNKFFRVSKFYTRKIKDDFVKK